MDGFETLGTGRPAEQSCRIVVEVLAAVRVVAFPMGVRGATLLARVACWARARCRWRASISCASSMVSVMRVVFYRGVVAPIENVATTVNDVDSAADRRSWLQWISGMQAPCARAPEGAMERNDGPSLTAIASSENRFSPTATHRHDHSDLRTPSQIQRVLGGAIAIRDARCWKVLQMKPRSDTMTVSPLPSHPDHTASVGRCVTCARRTLHSTLAAIGRRGPIHVPRGLVECTHRIPRRTSFPRSCRPCSRTASCRTRAAATRSTPMARWCASMWKATVVARAMVGRCCLETTCRPASSAAGGPAPAMPGARNRRPR